MQQNIGSIMGTARENGFRAVAVFLGVLVYAGMIAYSAVHNWALMARGVEPDMLVWAAVGVIGLELSAVALPVALHFWTYSPVQRIAAFAFYLVDLALIFFNVVLAFSLAADTIRPAWFDTYLLFIVPASPIIAGLGWSVLFLLDPSQRERSMVETLRASTREALAVRIAQEARAEAVNSLVADSARAMASGIVRETLRLDPGNPTRPAGEALPLAGNAEPVLSKNGQAEGRT